MTSDSKLVRRFGSMTADDVAALDAAAVDLGVGLVQLMETAGLQVARLAWRMLHPRPNAVHVVAGRGHNGGDGMVAARHLSAWGCTVSATLHADPESLDALMQQQCQAARGAGVEVRIVSAAAPDAIVGDVGLIIDALVGTGFQGRLRPAMLRVIRSLRAPILSVDVPSGMHATDGSAASGAVRATATCTLGAVKRGFWQPRAWQHTGELYVADIGVPPDAWTRCGLAQPTATRGGTLRRVPLSH